MTLQGEHVVFARFKDEALKKVVESLGGKVTMTVSSITTILVVAQGTFPTIKEKTMAKIQNIQLFDQHSFNVFLKQKQTKYQAQAHAQDINGITIEIIKTTHDKDASNASNASKTRKKTNTVPPKIPSPAKNPSPTGTRTTSPRKQENDMARKVPTFVTLPKFEIEHSKRFVSDSPSIESIYTIDKFVKDVMIDKFVQRAIDCEIECLKNKLIVYKKLNKVDWSAEVLDKNKGTHYSTNLNDVLTAMYIRIQDKLKSPRPSVEQKRTQLLDIIYNADVGLDTIKGQARSEVRSQIVKFMYMFFKAPTFFSSTFTNFMLTGSAGSGKTKIAMNIAHVMSNIGLMVTNNVISATRQTLVGQTIGESAPKTRFILAKAIEGVFFIDEAYTLTACPGQGTKNSSFEREAMGELINLMDKFIGCMVVIVAGYKKEMRECFLPFNEGLARRFPRVFDLIPYTSPDMWYLFATFLEPSILKNLNSQQKSMIASYINAFNSYPGINVFANQAGDMLNLAHLITEDYLLSETDYKPNEVTGSFVTFLRRKNMSIDID